MLIAQICYLAPPAIGGVEKHVLELSRSLKKAGHKIEIHTSFFYDLQGTTIKQAPNDEIPTYRYAGRFVKKTRIFSQPIHFPKLFFGLLKTRPDVVHVHSMASQHLEISYLYAKLFNKPLVVTGHYSAADLERLFTKRKRGKKTLRLIYWQRRLRKIMEYATLIAITKDEADAYQKYFGFKNIAVIPNGIDLTEFKPKDQKENFLIFVGRIVHAKRIEFLLEAHKKLKHPVPLIIAGYAPDKEYLNRLKTQAGCGVSFVNPSREQLIELLSNAEALVLPSKNEAFGIVLLEAMASKAVVLASNSGGFPEVLADAGLLFDPDDVIDLSKKISYLKDQKLCDSLRDKGLKRVQNFNWDLLAEKVLEVYSNSSR
ncbi:MAG: glycosyltransferase family 4 protein [Firmicutes bacterium]|nr:glycosyltransferase family 4 protein [Bacillota bacterium]